MMHIFKGFVVFISAVTLLLPLVKASIYCKNDDNKDVDWFFMYKLPNGGQYVYVDSNTPPTEGFWTLSSKIINETGGALNNTIAPMIAAERGMVQLQDLTYAVYNDEVQHKQFPTYGHTKGLFLFDKEKGVWLIHSVPSFPELAKNMSAFFPDKGLAKSQMFLCVTLPSTEMETIAEHLLLQHPKIYASASGSHWKDRHFLNLLLKQKFSRKAPFNLTATLTDAAGKTYTSFATPKHFKKDVYSGLVSPRLKTNLVVSTWRNGPGIKVSPQHSGSCTVENILELTFKLRVGKPVDVKNSVDHSKWAISSDPAKPFVCVGTLNRMESQQKRGGETLCFNNALLYKRLLDTVALVESCAPRKRGRE